MGVPCHDPSGGKFDEFPALRIVEIVREKVFREMAGFQQDGYTGAGCEFGSSLRQGCLIRKYPVSEQDLGFGNIRGYHPGHGDEFFLEGPDCAFLDQTVSAGGNHHRIQDYVLHPVIFQDLRYPAHDSAALKHADLDGIGAYIVQDGSDLAFDDVFRYRMHGRHSDRVLDSDGCDGACCIASQGRNRLDVGLDSRASAAVAAGYCQDSEVVLVLHLFHFRCNVLGLS